MAKVLLTGISRGIGKQLAGSLTKDGHKVLGVSRSSGVKIDLSKDGSGKKLLTILKRKKFKPSIVIFNAAILENDLAPKLDTTITRRMFATNFFSVLEALEGLLNYVPKNTHFIAISSVAALRGSSVEGIGYAASKAALSVAFEGLHQKYKNKDLEFTTIYLGPVNGGMSPFQSKAPFLLSTKQVVNLITLAIKERKSAYYSPFILFFGFRLLRLLPVSLGSNILAAIEKIHKKYGH